MVFEIANQNLEDPYVYVAFSGPNSRGLRGGENSYSLAVDKSCPAGSEKIMGFPAFISAVPQSRAPIFGGVHVASCGTK